MKVSKSTNGCWVWTGSLSRYGYGNFRAGQSTMLAHRYSYLLHYGELPRAEVCHTCDNPACVRPDHLFLGTHIENMYDAARKGRMGRKGRKGMAITDDIVRSIHALAGSMSQQAIGQQFGISQSHVSRIIHRKTSWSVVA